MAPIHYRASIAEQVCTWPLTHLNPCHLRVNVFLDETFLQFSFRKCSFLHGGFDFQKLQYLKKKL